MLKTSACCPVHVFLVSVIEALFFGDLSGSVAELACGRKVRVHSVSAAMWADDWVVVVHGSAL